MTSLYMPSVVVEIAFDSGYTTPAASRTWTDVSDYVELADRIRIGFGRQDEQSTAGANQISLTLDNTDGRFTARRTASPYYPNVKIGRPIRVKVTPPGGSTVTRFVGFIDQWPVEWDGTDAYAAARITASSRLARLGLSTKLRSMIESEILSTRPHRYWTLGDPAESTVASDSTGSPSLPVATIPTGGPGVVFGNGTGPGTDGLTAAQFESADDDGARLYGESALALPAGSMTLRCWALVTGLPAVDRAIFVSVAGRGICVSPAGLVQNRDGTLTGPSINDGQGHDLALTVDGTNEILYVDGVQVATQGGGLGAAAATAMFAGMIDGTLAHIAVYDTVLTAAQVASQAEIVLSGAEGDRTDERLARILEWAGVASTEITAETGIETMTYQKTSGQSFTDALRDVESTEGGVLFDGADGNVHFHNRSHRYQQTAAATLDMASQHVGTDYAPRLDRTALANDVTVSNPTTEQTARATDTTSSDEYGVAATSTTSVADTYEPLQLKAAWLIASYAEPRPRVPSLTVDVLAHQGLTPSAQTLLGITVGDLLAVTNAPAQADTTSPSYFVEGYTEDIGPESYSLTFNLSPTYPTGDVLILDDATRGLLDTGILAL